MYMQYVDKDMVVFGNIILADICSHIFCDIASFPVILSHENLGFVTCASLWGPPCNRRCKKKQIKPLQVHCLQMRLCVSRFRFSIGPGRLKEYCNRESKTCAIILMRVNSQEMCQFSNP